MKYNIEKLKQAVADSHSFSQVIRKLGLIVAGGNYKTVKSKIYHENIDISHFTGQGHLKDKTHNWAAKRPLQEVLVENSTYTCSNSLRKRLINEGVFERVCNNCKNAEWLDRPIPLELDHKNGHNMDHRLENLQLLCPNCHALTHNYRGKNKNAQAVVAHG